jgi:Flp pilus assembly protein TadD
VNPDLGLERDLERARRQIAAGDLHGAVETLRRVLGAEPDDSFAHSLLASALLRQKRLEAAHHEARIGVELDVESGLAHEMLGRVYLARRQFSKADEHLRRAIELEPEEPSRRLARALLLGLQGRRDDALVELERALALDAGDPAIYAALADHHLARGDLDRAESNARDALELEPEHADALVAMGHVLLRRGRADEAREHAVWALQAEASDEGALRLLAAIKAHQSWTLGLWWRYNAWLGGMRDRRIVLVLLGAYVLQRMGRAFANVHDYGMTAQLIEYTWLAICVYSWVGPVLFQRAVARELETVELDKNF